MKAIHLLIAAARAMVLLALSTGCVSVTKYAYKDTPKTGVQFESAAAASTFYDALLSQKFPAHGPPNGTVAIYLPMPYHHVTQKSANMVFNSAVARADANHDGVISEDESRAFAALK